MPDWFYRTVSRPMLFRLPVTVSRDLALGVVGTLARLPLGPFVIDLLGHMRPDPRLRTTVLGSTFPSPVGLGVGIDAKLIGLPALARFGFGFIEVGPVTVQPRSAAPLQRRPQRQAIWYPEPCGTLGLEALLRRLRRDRPPVLPLMVRLTAPPEAAPEQAAADCGTLIEQLAPYAGLFSLATVGPVLTGAWSLDQWHKHLNAVQQAIQRHAPGRGLLVCLPADIKEELLQGLLGPPGGVGGVVIDGTICDPPSGRLLGAPARESTLHLVRQVRQYRPDLVLVSSGGIHEPEHGLELLAAGANLVQIDSGLIYSGPGLPKRLNEAILWARGARHADPEQQPWTQATWFWTLLIGLSMLLGGVIALSIASTRVVLPYDEALAHMSRAELARVNDRLLAFMTHDRVTLAGTMLAVGILYTGLSLFAVRRGVHWARVTILTSSFTGFGSFFLFLGFGYFDPFHAFVTTILFQFLLFALFSRLNPPVEVLPPNLYEDRRWRLCQWGQFLFVLHGTVLIVAGATICTVGVTSVFVPEDLAFMQTTAAALERANPHLIPLVAHDRASFGGMLIATGVAVLLTSLWGFRQGQRWLWWTLLLAGTTAYLATIWVHLAVGYTDLGHLLPAYGGLAVLVLASALSYAYLCRPDPQQVRRWQRWQEKLAG
jgi:dihydroorotate dehydrogenase